MSKWTKDQLEAINKGGSNIIVSAGAGSGKTSVLTERVIAKLKKGIKINELLILTFTNLASGEMKERIRSKIYEDENLKDNLAYLESAYITTFDSYTLSLVKKYHYLLNISAHINIADASIINIIKKDYLDEVFLEFYDRKDPLFLKLVNDLTIKNDTDLKKSLLDIINKIALISDKDTYLNNYLDNYLSDDKIKSYLDDYDHLLKKEIDNIKDNLTDILNNNYADYYDKLNNALDKLLKAKTYDDVKSNFTLSIPSRPKNSLDIKVYKDNIDTSLKKLDNYLRFTNTKEIRETLLILKDYLFIIIKIIKRFYQKLANYKQENNLYEFNDIEIMAIKILKENPIVCEEVKNSFQEILVDEYQDTSDLQEEFINLIGNNNVYMVGDIKQSIYRFRNANPEIFQNKYDAYSKNIGGIKIDLLANFRSRKEVVLGINEIFSCIMDEEVGSANYRLEHLMQYGNKIYDQLKTKEDYHIEILNYQNPFPDYQNREIEAFIIGRDILKKVNSKYLIADLKTESLRPVNFNDFCLIMDRGKNFNLYQKIFNYLGIPLTIYEDKTLSNETDIMLISNIIDFILQLKENNLAEEFTYSFLSIARSFLTPMNDEEIFTIIKNKTYQDTFIYQVSWEISKYVDTYDIYEIINLILDKFHFYEKVITLNNIKEREIRVDNLLHIASKMSTLGYTLKDFSLYLKKMIAGNEEIKYSAKMGDNGVKIMNIHKSKGLEFPICYFAGLDESFNRDDLKKRYTFSPKYGIITPFFKDGIDNSILKDLSKEEFLINDISEKIRLFYVALTRAKEKIIMVTSLDNENDTKKNLVDSSVRREYNSFQSILNSLYYNLSKYIKNINVSNLNLTKDYLYDKPLSKINNYDNKKDKITYEEVKITAKVKNSMHPSSMVETLLSDEEKANINLGLKMHQVFEQTNFFDISLSNPYYLEINNLIKKLDIKKSDTLYKEHEFTFTSDNITYNGIIDLIIESRDVIKIVDYKLSEIDNPKYIKQLSIYKKYLSNISGKEIKMYLYSILNGELKEIIFTPV